MKDSNVEALTKRTRFDSVCTLIFSGIFAVFAVLKLVWHAPDAACSNAFLSVIFLLTGLIFLDIRKNGKPFAKSVINKMRAIAICVMCSGIVPEIVGSIARGAATDHYELMIDDRHVISMMLIGVIIGIFSELFVYGHSLQDDMDQIA